jgi:hypothetical protein
MYDVHTRQKQKATFSEISHQQGHKNSQYGTRWITNGVRNTKIGKSESIPPGFKLGRVLISV